MKRRVLLKMLGLAPVVATVGFAAKETLSAQALAHNDRLAWDLIHDAFADVELGPWVNPPLTFGNYRASTTVREWKTNWGPEQLDLFDEYPSD